MQRSELEHVIRAASSIADDRDIVVVGSQSIAGSLLTLAESRAGRPSG